MHSKEERNTSNTYIHRVKKSGARCLDMQPSFPILKASKCATSLDIFCLIWCVKRKTQKRSLLTTLDFNIINRSWPYSQYPCLNIDALLSSPSFQSFYLVLLSNIPPLPQTRIPKSLTSKLKSFTLRFHAHILPSSASDSILRLYFYPAPAFLGGCPSIQSFYPVLLSSPSIQSFYPVLLSSPSIQSFSPVLLSSPSLQSFYPVLLSSPSIQSFYPVLLSSPSIQSFYPVLLSSPSIQSFYPISQRSFYPISQRSFSK